MIRRVYFILIGCLVCAALPAIAQTADYLQGASPRLQLFAAARGDSTIPHMQRNQGLVGGAGLITARAGLAPVLRHDSNINGGTPGKTIKIGGLDFTLSEESRAKAGLVAGAAPSARIKAALWRGNTLEASASATYLRALRHDLKTQSHRARLCDGQYLGGATWADICISQSASLRALGTSREVARSAALSRQVAALGGVMELSAKLEKIRTSDYEDTFVSGAVTYAAPRLGTLSFGVDKGRGAVGEHTRQIGGNLSLARTIFGAPTTLFASAAREGGASFFGTPRNDSVYALGISRNFGPRMQVSLSWQRRRSTLENYNGDTIGFDIAFADLRF